MEKPAMSAITLLDGTEGVVRYRGYPVEELAEHRSFLEVAWLLIHGELPDRDELAAWRDAVTHHTMVHESVKKFVDGFQGGAAPMGIFLSTIGALSTFYPEADDVDDTAARRLQIVRLIAKAPTVAAYAYRHGSGLPYVLPDNDLGYAANFLSLMFRMVEARYRVDPVLERALEVLLIVHADNGLDCSAHVMRTIGSTHENPYWALAGAAAALHGSLHAGGPGAVAGMLRDIGSVARLRPFLDGAKRGTRRLEGFGPPVFTADDPRAGVLRAQARQVLAATPGSPVLDVAEALERAASDDADLRDAGLRPNVQFYTAVLYEALRFPQEMFPVMAAVARVAGWLAHWEEMIADPARAEWRPQQVYTGPPLRHLPYLDESDSDREMVSV
jgi:citrate synthase